MGSKSPEAALTWISALGGTQEGICDSEQEVQSPLRVQPHQFKVPSTPQREDPGSAGSMSRADSAGVPRASGTAGIARGPCHRDSWPSPAEAK